MNPKLQAIAQAHGQNELAGGKNARAGPSRGEASGRRAGNTYARCPAASVTRPRAPTRSDGRRIIGDARPDDVGIGIAAGRCTRNRRGRIWIVVLLPRTLGLGPT